MVLQANQQSSLPRLAWAGHFPDGAGGPDGGSAGDGDRTPARPAPDLLHATVAGGAAAVAVTHRAADRQLRLQTRTPETVVQLRQPDSGGRRPVPVAQDGLLQWRAQVYVESTRQYEDNLQATRMRLNS